MNNFKSIFITLTITLISFSLLAQNETNSELYRHNTGIKSPAAARLHHVVLLNNNNSIQYLRMGHEF
jgi:hypothetical protein